MLVLASQASVALVAVLLRLWYGYENARRERKALAMGALPEKKDQAWLNREFFLLVWVLAGAVPITRTVTDKENTKFRYRY
jgi:hypothetical protein